MSADPAAPGRHGSAGEAHASGHSRGWRWARRGIVLVFFAAVATLLIKQARTIEWGQVLYSVAELPPWTLVLATCVVAASHAIYSTYDLFGRRLTGHSLGTGTVMGVTFISYAFNLNLGSMVGGLAFRYRLYGRLGLKVEQVTRIIGMSLLTNWSGYLLVAGTAFFFWTPQLPPDWKLDGQGLRNLGAGALILVAAYVALCAWAHGRSWMVRGHRIELPGLRMALVQVLVSAFNWCLVGTVVWLLLQGRVGYPHVLAVLLCSVVAGLIIRVPGGLGVLETVFVALLAYRVPQTELLAALLAYRGVYYLLPLVVASVAYAITEIRARKLGGRSPGKQRSPRHCPS